MGLNLYSKHPSTHVLQRITDGFREIHLAQLSHQIRRRILVSVRHYLPGHPGLVKTNRQHLCHLFGVVVGADHHGPIYLNLQFPVPLLA